jgi:hypothetical protein
MDLTILISIKLRSVDIGRSTATTNISNIIDNVDDPLGGSDIDDPELSASDSENSYRSDEEGSDDNGESISAVVADLTGNQVSLYVIFRDQNAHSRPSNRWK